LAGKFPHFKPTIDQEGEVREVRKYEMVNKGANSMGAIYFGQFLNN
jgi:hypothetical protein